MDLLKRASQQQPKDSPAPPVCQSVDEQLVCEIAEDALNKSHFCFLEASSLLPHSDL